MAAATIKDIRELPEILTMRQVQEFLGLSKPKTYELAHMAGFPVIRFGRVLLVSRESLLSWLDKQAQEHKR
jgi:excisionase family DNA binding protein